MSTSHSMFPMRITNGYEIFGTPRLRLIHTSCVIFPMWRHFRPPAHYHKNQEQDHEPGPTSESYKNSVTDNPNIFIGEDEIISGGNFHGQPLALGLDYLKIAISELGNISERRTYQLVSGLRGLPAFLVDNPGLNSGFMIPQYTAASIVSANKQMASPASVDSIVSSNGQEDHVSMGANAAVQCYEVIANVERILAIELLNASQALEFRKPKQSSPLIEAFLKSYRETVPFVKEDLVFYKLMQDTLQFIDDFYIENELLFD